MKNGAFVSDEVMVKLIDSELGKLGADQGWLLDGFPRTMTQAQTLDHTLDSLNQPLNLVIHLNVPEEVILQRIMGKLSWKGRKWSGGRRITKKEKRGEEQIQEEADVQEELGKAYANAFTLWIKQNNRSLGAYPIGKSV